MTTLLPISSQTSHGALLWSVIRGRTRPGLAWRKKRFGMKFLLRCCCYPKVSYRYLQALTQLEAFPRLMEQQGLLPAKIHRPYMSAGFTLRQRALTILGHYQFIAAAPSPGLRQLFSQTSLTPWLTLSGANDSSFQFSYGPARFDREGEATICLSYQQQPVATVTFALTPGGMMIGGLQGPGHDEASTVIREATRAAYGLFPKRLLMEVVMMLASVCGMPQIQAVSEETHVFRSLRYRRSKQDKFFASYSDFWESLGGVKNTQGLFELPLQITRKPLEEVVSKKRSEYRRRYQLLDNLAQQFDTAVGKDAGTR